MQVLLDFSGKKKNNEKQVNDIETKKLKRNSLIQVKNIYIHKPRDPNFEGNFPKNNLELRQREFSQDFSFYIYSKNTSSFGLKGKKNTFYQAFSHNIIDSY